MKLKERILEGNGLPSKSYKKKCQKALYRCDIKDLIEHDFYKGDIMCDLVTKKTRPRDAFAIFASKK